MDATESSGLDQAAGPGAFVEGQVIDLLVNELLDERREQLQIELAESLLASLGLKL